MHDGQYAGNIVTTRVRFKRGIENGPWKKFKLLEDGSEQILEQGSYRNGQKDGAFYKDGKLLGHYENGQRVGEWQVGSRYSPISNFYENGTMVRSVYTQYKPSSPLSIQSTFDADRKLQAVEVRNQNQIDEERSQRAIKKLEQVQKFDRIKQFIGWDTRTDKERSWAQHNVVKAYVFK